MQQEQLAKFLVFVNVDLSFFRERNLGVYFVHPSFYQKIVGYDLCESSGS